MAEISSIHPLAAHFDRIAGAPAGRAGIRASLPAYARIVQVLAFAGRADDIAPRLQQGEGLDSRTGGPGEWFVLARTAGALSGLRAALGDSAAIIDQSDARVPLRLEGPDVRALLAKGTAVDLHPETFGVGRSATTMFGHFTVHLTRVSEDGYELLLARNFADSFWEALLEMGREFGIAR